MVKKKEIIQVIENDASLRRRYIDGEDCCVIGGLALAAGVSKDTLRSCGTASIDADINFNPISRNALNSIQAALGEKFGLSIDQLAKLQSINDLYKKTEERREALIKVVRKL